MEYDLEINKAITEIKKTKAKLVLLQLPDGLKEKAKYISGKIKKETNTKLLIWAGSCFGACDIPYQVEKMGVDLVISWGHSKWEKKEIK